MGCLLRGTIGTLQRLAVRVLCTVGYGPYPDTVSQNFMFLIECFVLIFDLRIKSVMAWVHLGGIFQKLIEKKFHSEIRRSSRFFLLCSLHLHFDFSFLLSFVFLLDLENETFAYFQHYLVPSVTLYTTPKVYVMD